MRRCVFLTTAAALGLTTLLAASPAPQRKDEAPKAPVERGKALYARHCEICHYAQSEASKIGSGLKGIYKKGKYPDGKKVDDASMRHWIEKGSNKMPPLRDTLTDQQITDLIAYIRTL